MGTPTIRHVRAFTVRGGGADYHDQGKEHWIDDHIATPMARYPEYRQSRQSFGINVLGTLVGVLLLGVMSNGLNILQVNSYLQLVLTGLIILLAVLLSGLARRGE